MKFGKQQQTVKDILLENKDDSAIVELCLFAKRKICDIDAENTAKPEAFEATINGITVKYKSVDSYHSDIKMRNIARMLHARYEHFDHCGMSSISEMVDDIREHHSKMTEEQGLFFNKELGRIYSEIEGKKQEEAREKVKRNKSIRKSFAYFIAPVFFGLPAAAILIDLSFPWLKALFSQL